MSTFGPKTLPKRSRALAERLGFSIFLEACSLNRGEKRMTKEMVLFESGDGKVSLPVPMDGNTVWLSQKQMAELFGKDQSVISRHIKNAVSEGEVDISTNYAKFAYSVENVAGSVEIDVYDLDVVISVGYRVHSPRGVEFRRWATKILKDYIIKGAAINKKRLQQLGQAVEVMKRVSKRRK